MAFLSGSLRWRASRGRRWCWPRSCRASRTAAPHPPRCTPPGAGPRSRRAGRGRCHHGLSSGAASARGGGPPQPRFGPERVRPVHAPHQRLTGASARAARRPDLSTAGRVLHRCRQRSSRRTPQAPTPHRAARVRRGQAEPAPAARCRGLRVLVFRPTTTPWVSHACADTLVRERVLCQYVRARACV